MATILAKYSDYVIQSIEYFITQIENELEYRDINGLTNSHVEKINVTKQHPLVSLMASSLNDAGTDLLRNGLLPSISVTPGSQTGKGFTLGQSFKSESVDDDFIALLDTYAAKTQKQRLEDGLLTSKQITTIKNTYSASGTGVVRLQRTEWHKSEEINISVWSLDADTDIILGNMMDSILASIQAGFAGDDSEMRDFDYKIVKGLTNFNFGRVLYGSEYNLTFLNTYNNYTIYTDTVLSGHDLVGTYQIPEGDFY